MADNRTPGVVFAPTFGNADITAEEQVAGSAQGPIQTLSFRPKRTPAVTGGFSPRGVAERGQPRGTNAAVWEALFHVLGLSPGSFGALQSEQQVAAQLPPSGDAGPVFGGGGSAPAPGFAVQQPPFSGSRVEGGGRGPGVFGGARRA